MSDDEDEGTDVLDWHIYNFPERDVGAQGEGEGEAYYEVQPDSVPGLLLLLALASDAWQIVENEYPWLCSLTYNNNHICGITLLSGPPHATILAGAAHCYSPGDSPSSYRVGMTSSTCNGYSPSGDLRRAQPAQPRRS